MFLSYPTENSQIKLRNTSRSSTSTLAPIYHLNSCSILGRLLSLTNWLQYVGPRISCYDLGRWFFSVKSWQITRQRNVMTCAVFPTKRPKPELRLGSRSEGKNSKTKSSSVRSTLPILHIRRNKLKVCMRTRFTISFRPTWQCKNEQEKQGEKIIKKERGNKQITTVNIKIRNSKGNRQTERGKKKERNRGKQFHFTLILRNGCRYDILRHAPKVDCRYL